MRVDDPDFEQMANQSEGQIIWVVLDSGQLLTAPSYVAHTVLSAGEAVIAAGDAIVAINGNERFCIEITNNSDHYQSNDQSLEIGKQAFGQFGVRFAEEERPRDDGYGEGTSGVGAYNAAPQEEPRVFANTHPEDLAAELETAAILGISSMHVDDPDFRQLANDGPIKWVVTQGGDLLVASSIVAHTVLTNGEAVIAAGEAEVEVNGHKRGLAINTKSDHYQADERSLEIGRRAFEAFGVEFSSAAGRDGSGNGHGGVAVETIEHAPPSPQQEGLEQQASISGTSHVEMGQEPEAREVADGGYSGHGDGNGGDGYGRVDANRLREVKEAMQELLMMWANRNSAGDDVQVEYERGESSQAQLPEGGESGHGGERGDENSGGQDGGNGGGNNGDHVVLDGESSGDESDEDEDRFRRVVDYINEALLRSVSESDSNVDVTVRLDEARREVLELLKEVTRDLLNNQQPEYSEAMRELFTKLGIEIPEDREARREFFEEMRRAERAKGPIKLSDELYQSYSHLGNELSEIEEKLYTHWRTDMFQIIERVSQEPRIQGFAEWVSWTANNNANGVFDHVMELTEAQRMLQFNDYVNDPSVTIRIGDDVQNPMSSFDVVVKKPDAEEPLLHQIEVYTPEGGIEKIKGDEIIEGAIHGAEKIWKFIDYKEKHPEEFNGSESPPHGCLEATVVVDPWPPTRVFHVNSAEGKQHLVYGTHGEGTLFADTNLTETSGKSLFDKIVDRLNQAVYYTKDDTKDKKYRLETLNQVNVIDRNGRLLCVFINTTPDRSSNRTRSWRPATWRRRDPQGE
jgi:hypothetical protein